MTGLDRLIAGYPEQWERAVRAFSPARTSRTPTGSRPAAIVIPETPFVCARMQAELDKGLKELTEHHRHVHLQPALLRLVRCGTYGHQGLRQALAQLKEEFVSKTADARAGGSRESSQEFDASLRRGLAVIEPGVLDPMPCCQCLGKRLRQAIQTPGAVGSGLGGATDRLVMAYRVHWAERLRSLIGHPSQRQISEAIDRQQPTVSASVQRLKDAGLLLGVAPHQLDRGATLAIDARELLNFVSAVPPAPAEPCTDTNMSAEVHRLFGPQGLRGGVLETYALLSLSTRPLPSRRGYLVVTHLEARRPSDQRRVRGRAVPAPRVGGGRTVAELVTLSGKSRQTIRRHLHKLARVHLAFERDGLWFRYHADVEYVAERLEIPDTAELKRNRHDFQRQDYWASMTGRRRDALDMRVVNGRTLYVDPVTGEVMYEGTT